MSARDAILHRLRQKPHNAGASAGAGTLPARQITRTSVDEFVVQAKLSGAQVVRCTSSVEWEQAKAEFINENATVVNAALGIAETGSVVLRSIDTPSAASYICDHLVVCVPESSVVVYLHQGLALLKSQITRALHLMTGPSRTADVEQTIQIGAHGPRRLTILIH